MSSLSSQTYASGKSPIESLPFGLLHNILLSVSPTPELEKQISFLQNLPSNHSNLRSIQIGTNSRVIDDPNTKIHERPCLLPCLLTSRTLCGTAVPVSYRNAQIPHISTNIQQISVADYRPAILGVVSSNVRFIWLLFVDRCSGRDLQSHP